MNWIAGWITPEGCSKRCRCWKSFRNGNKIRVYMHPNFRMVFAQAVGDDNFIIVSADASVERIKKLMENADA